MRVIFMVLKKERFRKARKRANSRLFCQMHREAIEFHAMIVPTAGILFKRVEL